LEEAIVTDSTTVESLPEILPVFPLTGVLLLPGTVLPLHIFEPRYRNLVEDALGAGNIFGMIQPFTPQHDNRPLPGSEKETPEIYKVGCAGRIEACEKSEDGRYMIQLRGLTRFRFEEEMPLVRGYRRVKAVYRDFSDLAPETDWQCDRPALIKAIEEYGKTHGLQLRLDEATRISDVEIVNLLSVSLPFHPAEKQALLEARSMKDRESVLVNLLRIGTGPPDSGSEVPPRTLN
jgi:uncharacterized protein